jgi:hypothetical protein
MGEKLTIDAIQQAVKALKEADTQPSKPLVFIEPWPGSAELIRELCGPDVTIVSPIPPPGA